MSRTAYPPQSLLKQSSTLPPKAMDMKFYSEYPDPIDVLNWNLEFVFFSFTFFEDQNEDRSPAFQFLIEIENIDTGVVKSFVQIANRTTYKFWQQSDRFLLDETLEEAIVNGRVTVTPINDFGQGEKSVFFLPFKDLIWTRSKNNQDIFNVLNRDWALFSETPDTRENRPKVMYIYLDVSKEIIEKDRETLQEDKYQFTSLTDSRLINANTYRWLVSEDYYKLDKEQWHLSTKEEKEFIMDIVQTMLPSYREYITEQALNIDAPNIFKIAVENPTDNRDSIIIYLLNGRGLI